MIFDCGWGEPAKNNYELLKVMIMKKHLVIGAALSAMSLGGAYAGELSIGLAGEGFSYDQPNAGDVSVSTSGIVVHGDSSLGDTNFVIGAETFISMQGDVESDQWDDTGDGELRTFKATIGYDFKFFQDTFKVTPVIGYQLGNGKLDYDSYELDGLIAGMRADYAIDEHLSVYAGFLVGKSTIDFDDADSFDATSGSLSFGLGYNF
ncbi:porin family protein [Vibrio parahaemolyticus]|nr:porin family protein [Vibrio parahaemolyticus]